MNLFLALGQLGLTRDFQREQLFPIGTLYDPFVCRGLDALIYGVYSGSRFVVLGTPSRDLPLPRGRRASVDDHARRSAWSCPASLYAEPTYARELEWLLLDQLRRMQEPDGEALYLRLSTKPIDQAPFAELCEARGEEAVRADVLAGGVLAARSRAGHGRRRARDLRRDGARGRCGRRRCSTRTRA